MENLLSDEGRNIKIDCHKKKYKERERKEERERKRLVDIYSSLMNHY